MKKVTIPEPTDYSNKVYELDYKEVIYNIIENGSAKKVRGHETISLFGLHYEIDFKYMKGRFPLITGRKMFPKNFIAEFLWIMGGGTHIQDLQENEVHIWDDWADHMGYLGPIYGYQLRMFNGENCDQLEYIKTLLEKEPTSRRMIMTMWNPLQLKKMALPPCHHTIQFNVNSNKYLDIMVMQRSADVMVGLPYDIALYSVMMEVFSSMFSYSPGKLIFSIGDAHIYDNHWEGMETYLKTLLYEPPYLEFNEKYFMKDFNDDSRKYMPCNIPFEEIKLTKYKHGPHINFKIAK